MNEEETLKLIEMTINKSNKEYISLKEQFEELRDDYIELARIEEQLQNNWNELKKFCKGGEEILLEKQEYNSANVYALVLDIMQELEGNNE